MRKILKLSLILIGIFSVLAILMASSGICPPRGPWPSPPWCGETNGNAGSGITPNVTFIVTVPEVTPGDDEVYIYSRDFPATKMTRVNSTTWKAEILVPPYKDVYYGYDRNNVGYETSEEVTSTDVNGDWFKKRKIRFEPPKSLTQFDTVKKWRWLLNEPPNVEIPQETAKFSPRVSGLNFQKGIAVIDYWWNVFFDNGETENTVKRIVEDKASYVQYSPTWTVDITDENIKLNKTCSYCYPEKAIRYEVRAAKSAGLKVIFRNQVWMDIPAEVITKKRSDEWWAQYYKTRREYLLDIAKIAQEEGVEAMDIGADYDTLSGFTTWGNSPGESWKKWVEDIQEVRKVYKGKIYYDFNPTGKLADSYSIDMKKFQSILDEVDFIGISWWKGISDKDNPALEGLEKNAGEQFDRYLKPVYEKTGKPLVLISIAFPSAQGGSTGKYLVNSRAVDVWKPEDDTNNDFREQAYVYEALMKAVADRPWIVGTYTFGYWRHDQQDKGYNIRGKPAEQVLKKWYSKTGE
ncbi:Uncharacterised protein [uncultured archaeon]|nr:Uncharacterised protein [uncultured archaeon]